MTERRTLERLIYRIFGLTHPDDCRHPAIAPGDRYCGRCGARLRPLS